MPIYEMLESTGGDDFEIIDEDSVLEAEVTKIEERVKPFKDDDGNEIIKCEFTFRITEDPHSGRTVWGDTSNKLTNHPDNKLRNWAQELMAQELPVGFKLNTDALVGLPCRVVIGVREWTDKTTQQKKRRNFVRDVVRVRRVAGVGASMDDPFA